MSNTYIFLLYAPIMFVMYYIANWIWLWTKLVEKLIYVCYPCICKYFRIKICLNQKGRKKPSLPCEKRITKTQELWTNKWCYNALCFEILMIYGIINLHNHMHFVRYLDVFTINSGVSFPLIVLIHVRYLNSLHKSLY